MPPERQGQDAAQATTGDRAHHRPPQGRSPIEPLPSPRGTGRQPARRAVCRGLRPALAVEDDRKKGIDPFLRLSGAAECSRFILNWLRRLFDLRTNALPFGGAQVEV